MQLRAYQQSIFDQITSSGTNDLVQLDTGAGKTPIIARLAEHYQHAVIVCHRNILIKQASEKLAMCGLQHRIIASRETKRICAANNIAKVGKHYINPRSTIELASIDTLNIQLKNKNLQIKNPAIILVDEAHHLADDNKWAALAEALGVRCVGFTATPCRGDGYPMLKRCGGFFERLLQADGYAENATERLISEGYLAQYSAYLAMQNSASDGRTLDTKKISLAHSVVWAYEQWAQNRQAIVIEPRIANAIETSNALRKDGVMAEVIHSGKPQHEIERILQAFERKQIRCLVAVDMINEGFDVPDADVLILARQIASFGLYRQLCGRVLRPRQGKHALILDLNGTSIARHGLPSDNVDWQQRQGQIKRKNLAVCENCQAFFKSTLSQCTECGHYHDVEKRATFGMSHLDLHFFDGKMIERERKRIERKQAELLLQQQRQAEADKDASEYREFSTSFSAGVLGRRCQQFYTAMQSTLKAHLTPKQYNDFFKKHNQDMGKADFYAGVMNAEFDKQRQKQCIRLYEVRK